MIQPTEGDIIPVEVKAADNVRAKCLGVFMKNMIFKKLSEYHQRILVSRIELKVFLYIQHLPLTNEYVLQ